ncbi:MAG: hypothetical protein BroJett018_29140 [Chloroflexota bacterium]|nr:MAG: hypothetical protein BroJett018_29140 [Chloroflexota bacterium]
MSTSNTNRLIPKLRIHDAAEALDFYQEAFGAVEVYRLTTPIGTVINAEMQIEGMPFIVAEENLDAGMPSPITLGGTTCQVDLQVADADAFAERAIAAGALVIFPVSDQFYGMRQGQLQDPFGHRWNIGTVTEPMTGEEMQRRFNAMMQGEG